MRALLLTTLLTVSCGSWFDQSGKIDTPSEQPSAQQPKPAKAPVVTTPESTPEPQIEPTIDETTPQAIEVLPEAPESQNDAQLELYNCLNAGELLTTCLPTVKEEYYYQRCLGELNCYLTINFTTKELSNSYTGWSVVIQNMKMIDEYEPKSPDEYTWKNYGVSMYRYSAQSLIDYSNN
jgi:hypothetical protein